LRAGMSTMMSTRVADSVQSSIRHSALLQFMNLHSTAQCNEYAEPGQGLQHRRQVNMSSTVEGSVCYNSAAASRGCLLKCRVERPHNPARPSPCCIPGCMVACLIGVVCPPCKVVQVT
jgi:hypothetical protein